MSENPSVSVQAIQTPKRSPAQLRSARDILEWLAQNPLSPKKLTKFQRLVCVKFFLDEKPEVTDNQIAQILRCSRTAIVGYRKKIFEHEKRWIERLDPMLEAAKLKATTEATIAKIQKLAEAASTEPKGKLAAGILWEKSHKIRMDLYEKLFDLGVLTQAPKKFAVDLTQDQKITLSLITEMAFARPKLSVKSEDDVGVLGRNGGEVAGASTN